MRVGVLSCLLRLKTTEGGESAFAWVVGFLEGDVAVQFKSQFYSGRAVRGGQ